MEISGIPTSDGLKDQMVSTDILLWLVAISVIILIACICIFARRVVSNRLNGCKKYLQEAYIAHEAVIANLQKQLSYGDSDEILDPKTFPMNFDEYEKVLIKNKDKVNTAVMDEKTRKKYMVIITEYPKLVETVHVEIGRMKEELIKLSESGGFLINFFVWTKRKQFFEYKDIVDNIGTLEIADIDNNKQAKDTDVIESIDNKKVIVNEEPDTSDKKDLLSGVSMEEELRRLQKANGHDN